MNGSRRSSWVIWTGPVFAVAFLLASFLLEGSAPGETASAAKVVSYYNAHQGRTIAEAVGAPMLAALLVLFVAELRHRARAAGERGVWPTAMMAGAVIWVAGIGIGSTIDLALATSANHHQAQVAQTLSVLNNASWIPFIAGVAVFLIGAGATVLSSRLLPTWLGWVALIAGLASLVGPGGIAGFFLAPVWITVAAVVLATRRSAAVANTPSPAERHAVVPA